MKTALLVALIAMSTSAYADNVIIKFYATWCPPCKTIAPMVKSISQRLNLKVQEVDLDSQTGGALAEKLSVDRIPTLLLVKDGVEVCRIIGASEEKILSETIEKCFKDKK
jgi:thioredoxin 1